MDDKKLVYVLVASKGLKYGKNRSRIAYIGTTKKGGSRIAGSVSSRCSSILGLHGVKEFEARIITCRPRQRVKMWIKLERALLLVFREMYDAVPKCNIQGKRFVESDEFDYFARARIKSILDHMA